MKGELLELMQVKKFSGHILLITLESSKCFNKLFQNTQVYEDVQDKLFDIDRLAFDEITSDLHLQKINLSWLVLSFLGGLWGSWLY